MKNCVNCKYSRDVGAYLACYGQKYAPKVSCDYVCEDWKPKYTTNADRIHAMTDEELASYAYKILANYACPPEREHATKTCNDMKANCDKCWLDWLKQGEEI